MCTSQLTAEIFTGVLPNIRKDENSKKKSEKKKVCKKIKTREKCFIFCKCQTA